MAIGSEQDIYDRLISNLPDWFGTDHPILDAILAAFNGFNQNPTQATTAYFHYNFQYLYAKLQLRIQTATDINLDLISQDYLGNALPRRQNENDESYRARILVNLVRPRATREAMRMALLQLTGYEPIIIEPWNFFDHGAYRVLPLAYNVGGGYGTNAPYQAWIYVFTDPNQGMGNYSGYRVPDGGYNAADGISTLYYGSETLIQKIVTNDAILELIENTKVAGTLIHTFINPAPTPIPITPELLLDNNGEIIFDNDGNIIYAGGA